MAARLRSRAPPYTFRFVQTIPATASRSSPGLPEPPLSRSRVVMKLVSAHPARHGVQMQVSGHLARWCSPLFLHQSPGFPKRSHRRDSRQTLNFRLELPINLLNDVSSTGQERNVQEIRRIRILPLRPRFRCVSERRHCCNLYGIHRRDCDGSSRLPDLRNIRSLGTSPRRPDDGEAGRLDYLHRGNAICCRAN